MTRKHILAMIASITLVAAVAMTAQQRVVILKDGRRITGEVTKTAQGYQVRTGKGTIVFPADEVAGVEDVTTPKDELTRRLDKVDPRDAEGFYLVARWADRQNMLAEAEKILLKVLKIEPGHENAQLLLKLVRIRLAGFTKPVPTATGPTGPVRPLAIDPARFLIKEDIYRIRLLELKHDDKVIIEFRNKVLDRFIESMRGREMFADPGGERRFRGWSKVRQARYILKNTDRDSVSVRDDILVKTDPEVIKQFRARIWPILARSFASPSCYGGPNGRDGTKLFNVPLTDNRILYTNFYILHKWSRGGRKFINRDKREMSLLLQYGLPKNLARMPAPDYMTPIFRSRNDRNYKLFDAWIGSLRWPFLPPGYRINYKLPGQGAAKPKPPTTKPAGK
jgi:hypothetical protein